MPSATRLVPVACPVATGTVCSGSPSRRTGRAALGRWQAAARRVASACGGTSPSGHAPPPRRASAGRPAARSSMPMGSTKCGAGSSAPSSTHAMWHTWAPMDTTHAVVTPHAHATACGSVWMTRLWKPRRQTTEASSCKERRHRPSGATSTHDEACTSAGAIWSWSHSAQRQMSCKAAHRVRACPSEQASRESAPPPR